MSNFRFILRKIFLIASGLIVIFLTAALYNTGNNESNLLDLGVLAIVFTAIGVNSLVVLYILEIEKKKLR